MKVLRWINIILVLAFLSSCSAGGVGGNGGFGNLFATPTPLPPPLVGITPAPDAQAAVTKYLEAMQKDDYAGMYDMLSTLSRSGITLEDFSSRYKNALNTMSAASFEFAILSNLLSPANAEVAYRITYHTSLVGDIQRDIVMRLANEAGTWKVQLSLIHI